MYVVVQRLTYMYNVVVHRFINRFTSYTCQLLVCSLLAIPGNLAVWTISQLDYMPDGHAPFAGHQVPCWWKCTQVSPTLGAMVSVRMPGMLGMPGKLGMLVAAGFSIFGGGGLRNVPTPPADQLGSLGGRGVPSCSSTSTFSRASSVCPRL